MLRVCTLTKPLAESWRFPALITSAALLSFCLLAISFDAEAQTPSQPSEPVVIPHAHQHRHGNETPKARAPQIAKVTIPDVMLLDQNGNSIRFYSDLVKGKVVFISFIYTTCTTVCPPVGRTFANIQRQLGERLGKEVLLISISIDPKTDTPERLRAWGAQFKAQPGWTFVTGEITEVDQLVRAFSNAPLDKEFHSPLIVIGNDVTGEWIRLYNSSAKLQPIVDSLKPAPAPH